MRPLCTWVPPPPPPGEQSFVWSIYYSANSKCKCWHTALCSVGKVLYTYFCAFLLLNVCIFRKVVFCILRVQSIKHITIHHNSFKRLGVGALFHIVKVWNWRVNHPPPFTHTHTLLFVFFLKSPKPNINTYSVDFFTDCTQLGDKGRKSSSLTPLVTPTKGISLLLPRDIANYICEKA